MKRRLTVALAAALSLVAFGAFVNAQAADADLLPLCLHIFYPPPGHDICIGD